MDDCILLKPTLSLHEEIQAYRRKMLEGNSSLDGTGPLKRMPNIEEWLEFNKLCENETTVPANWVTSEQYAFVRQEDQKIVGMLQAGLAILRECGFEKVLVTCLPDNEGSRRTILANGGVYESTVYCEPDGVHLERYWIQL